MIKKKKKHSKDIFWQTTNVTSSYNLETTTQKLLSDRDPLGRVNSVSTYMLTFTAAFIYFKHTLNVFCSSSIWLYVTVGLIFIVYSMLIVILILNFKSQLSFLIKVLSKHSFLESLFMATQWSHCDYNLSFVLLGAILTY